MTKLMMSAAIASVAALVAVVPALAADLSVAPMYKAPPPPMFTWSGLYIGGNIGAKSVDTGGSVTEGPIPAIGFTGATLGFPNERFTPLIGGGQVGYNWQRGPLVLGFEADVDAQRWSVTRTLAGAVAGGGAANAFVAGDSFSLESRWQASFRARVGYAWDRLLVYGTGGVAFTDASVGTNFVAFGGAPATSASDSTNLVGGTVGAGVEYAIWNNVSIGLEGRFTWYGDHTFNGGVVAFTAPPVVRTAPVTQTISLETAEILGKVNWKFWTPAY